MAHSIFGDPKVWIQRSQLKNRKIITTIECDSDPCKYYLEIINQEVIVLIPGEQMNYYVTSANLKTIFKFGPFSAESFKMNIWAKGGNQLRTELNRPAKQYMKNNFYVFDVKDDTYELTVNAKEGDFVNVGSLLFKDDLVYKELTVDESPVSIYLSKGYLDKACFNMQIKAKSEESRWIFGTGIIDSNIVRGYEEDDLGIVNGTMQVFNYGQINMYTFTENVHKRRICFDFPNETEYKSINDIVFTFQLTSGLTLNGGLNNFQPQQNGILYPRYLNKGQKAAFIGHFPGENYKEINYNMLNFIGFANMSIVECQDYPLCLKYGAKNPIYPHSVNRFTSYSVYRNETIGKYSPVNFTQTVLMVECGTSFESKDTFDAICIFGTLFYSELNSINLIENQYFNQYLLKNDQDKFKIDFLGQTTIKQIYVDINVFSGEVKTNVNDIKDGNIYKEYYNANKIYFVITLNSLSANKEVNFVVIGLKDSFYSIQYSFVRDGDDSNKKNYLEPGNSYLITINPKKQHSDYETQKIVSFTQSKSLVGIYPYLVNFYSLNCKLNILARRLYLNKTSLYTNIETYDYFSQDLYTFEENIEAFSAESFDYNITVVEEDFSDYDNKRCMVYASAIEITPHINEMVIPENTLQQIMFKKVLNNITYIYPNADQHNDLLIVFNLIDKAKYHVDIYFENYNEPNGYTVLKNENIKLSKKEIQTKCPEIYEICNIIIFIKLEQTVFESEPMLEFELKTISSNSVVFLQKNIMKTGFIIEDTVQYYYTEVGRNEEGSITINFLRGEGKVFAKIVDANLKKPEEGANWKGLYHLPTANDSLEYDMYLKKISYLTERDQCIEGCYLLITVYLDIESDPIVKRLFPFSIMVHSAPSERYYQQIPTMTIKTDYYVVGNLGHCADDLMTEFYDVWIYSDAYSVEIDFQSDAAGIFINVGDSKPTTKTADFKFYPNGKDRILTLSKNDIISKGKLRGISFPNNDNSIQNTILTFGIWTNSSDTVYTTVYSFLVHLSNNTVDDLDIHKVNSDQKALCIPKKTDNKQYPYRCLYAIESEEYNLGSK